MKARHHLIRFSAIASLAISSSFSVHAADGTWTSTATSGNWTDAGNWSSSVIANDSGFTANFTSDITAATVVSLAGDRAIGNLVFSDNGASGSAWTITGNTLTLAGTTPTLTTTTNATISSLLAGTSGFTKGGAGTLTLGSINTYTGQTTINAGTLKLGISASAATASTSALGSNAAGSNGTVVNSGATLDFNGYTVAKEVVTINGTGVGGNGALVNTGGTQNNAISYLTLGSDATIGGTGRFDLRNNSPILNMAGYTLTKKGTNTVYVTGGSITNAGNILVEQGEFAFAGVGTFSGTSGKTITVKNTATLTTSWSQVTVIGWDLQLENGARLYSYNDSGSTQNTFSGTAKLGTTVKFDTSGVMNITGNIEDLSGPGSIEKIGGNSLTLTGNNTYTGGTAVKVGKLLVNNTSGSGTGTGTVSVSSGATLGGTGSIGGAVNVSGVLSPGASVETLSSGTLSFLTGSTFAYETNSSVSLGVGADLQKVAGDLNLTGDVTLILTDLATMPVAFANGTTFSLINYTGIWNSGVFKIGANSLDDGEEFIAGLNTWKIDYNSATGGSNYSGEYFGGTDSFVNLTAVPEPRAALIGGLGLLCLLRRRRRLAEQSV